MGLILALVHTHVRARTHTHTHTELTAHARSIVPPCTNAHTAGHITWRRLETQAILIVTLGKTSVQGSGE